MDNGLLAISVNQLLKLPMNDVLLKYVNDGEARLGVEHRRCGDDWGVDSLLVDGDEDIFTRANQVDQIVQV